MFGATQIPPPYVRLIIEKTAKFISKHGLEIENRIIASNLKNARFMFLNSSDRFHAFYKHKLYEYQAQNQHGLEANDDAATGAQPDPLAQLMTLPEEDYTVILPEGITDDELDTVNLIVSVVARKGRSFLVELTRGEINNHPQSYSMNLIRSMFDFFDALVDSSTAILVKIGYYGVG
ncbi:unnamed protein product [Eruca vesicaria subsp. sativa]|uniref:SURP motif domain-containing protein n=1 Tax=Eruca vesicaria subsp. sativa TaxID=29727 RepID=A0ABC8LXV4_ERUVS|nr:unnamed protein product [Eruca vesicaria subsp. sativa]